MSLVVKVNQIVLLSIADHQTRNAIQNPSRSPRVLGALFGTQDGRILSILSSTELDFLADINTDEITSLDLGYLKEKIALVSTVYKNYDFLGWYCTWTAKHQKPDQSDIKFHKLLCSLNESPILLTLDPTKKMKLTNELAVKVYETKLDTKVESPHFLSEIPYEIQVDKSETVTVDHVLKNYSRNNTSGFADGISTIANSLNNLGNKLQDLLYLLESNKEIKEDKKLMRELRELLNSFPTKTHEGIDKKILNESCEANLINFLSSIMGINKQISDVMTMKSGFDSKYGRRSDYD